MTDERKIVFTYTGEDTAPAYIVSGGLGGTTPEHSLYVLLYAEYPSAPLLHAGTLDPETGQPVVTEVSPPQDEANALFKRQFQCRLVMDPGRARSLGLWLVEQAEAMLRGRGEML